MGQDKERFSNIRRLREALSEVTEVAVARPHHAPSSMKAISSSMDIFMSKDAELRAKIVTLEERLAISESLVDELRRELARRDGRSFGEGDPLGVE